MRLAARDDAETGEHLRFELAVGIHQRGAHGDPACDGVHLGADGSQLGFEGLFWQGEHPDFHLLAPLDEGRVRLRHGCDEPDGREIADGEHRRRGAGLDILSRPDLAVRHNAGDGGHYIGGRVGLFRGFDPRDLGVGLAEDAQSVGRRRGGVFGRCEVDLGLLPVLE